MGVKTWKFFKKRYADEIEFDEQQQWVRLRPVISEQDEEGSKVHGQTEKGNKSREHAFGRNKTN